MSHPYASNNFCHHCRQKHSVRRSFEPERIPTAKKCAKLESSPQECSTQNDQLLPWAFPVYETTSSFLEEGYIQLHSDNHLNMVTRKCRTLQTNYDLLMETNKFAQARSNFLQAENAELRTQIEALRKPKTLAETLAKSSPAASVDAGVVVSELNLVSTGTMKIKTFIDHMVKAKSSEPLDGQWSEDLCCAHCVNNLTSRNCQ